MAATFAPTLYELLKKTQVISEADLKRAQALQKTSGAKLIRILVDEGIISEKDLMLLLSSKLGIPALDLTAYKVDPKVLKLVPKKVAERYEIIPVSQIGNVISLAMSDPLDMVAMDDVKKITQCNVRPVIVAHRDIQTAIENYYSEEIKLEEVLSDLDADSIEVVDQSKSESGHDSHMADEAPVIRMVNLILQEAIKNRASDIHFEPTVDHLRIRFRVDGTLQEAFSPPRQMYNSILTRIKIVSNLDITEKRLPQDGRFKAKFENREIDFRVSALPIYHGEKLVLRVLDKANIKTGLNSLGFASESIQRFQESIKRPYGMVLVTGPTGSGKSTTLYSILNQLNTKERNIMTIEDPIEYQIHGITQTQVNPDIGLTFASGLRSLLRQSPDIILVGEIRDSETADIAVKAALTGHLVFSTLHTNNAAGAVTRLIDMEVEPFLIASSLIATTAQRLLRRICNNCREAYEIPKEVLDRLPLDQKWIKNAKGYKGKGCNQCKNSGYRGRLGVMEILPVDDAIQKLITENKSSGEIEIAARKKGMKSLFEEAMEGLNQGLTTLEEILRITTFED
ncbi:MAG: Flp pilus assembly complex ATPase component TadA [Candidatus Omnitrophica bacterium]|nr:Flp pilus assembly complex ATPase component TadA [Candidatus Omnitrophota bacterium]